MSTRTHELRPGYVLGHISRLLQSSPVQSNPDNLYRHTCYICIYIHTCVCEKACIHTSSLAVIVPNAIQRYWTLHMWAAVSQLVRGAGMLRHAAGKEIAYLAAALSSCLQPTRTEARHLRPVLAPVRPVLFGSLIGDSSKAAEVSEHCLHFSDHEPLAPRCGDSPRCLR